MISADISKLKKYYRDVGALCSGIPAIIYILMMAVYNSLTTYNIIWLSITFIPLIIAGWYLDIISDSKLFKAIGRWWMKIILAWVILFPLARGFSFSLISYLFKEGLDIYSFLLLLGGSALFGLLYGFFFMTTYIYLLKIFKRL